MISTCIDIVELESCNVAQIFDAVKTKLHRLNLDLTKLIAIGTDNASVMVGINNGVYHKLKQEIRLLS